jgi:hypothetical protein
MTQAPYLCIFGLLFTFGTIDAARAEAPADASIPRPTKNNSYWSLRQGVRTLRRMGAKHARHVEALFRHP